MAHKTTSQSKQRPPDEEREKLTEAAEKLWGDRKFGRQQKFLPQHSNSAVQPNPLKLQVKRRMLGT